MIYGSVCSGIEAASQAWQPLGWRPAFFSEIEPFPCAVLAHHHGSNLPGEPLASNGVPNLGDMTAYKGWPDDAIDVLVGGTPCQDYSIAGLRLGMDGARGQLSLTYIEIAARYRPDWVVWENVPGVLSSNGGRDFARFLGDLAGVSLPVPPGGWSTAGIVAGIPDAYGLAYRVLDAQFVRVDGFPHAVPQRRRRVFVVGYLGDWRRAAAVLFERESLQGHPAPGRQTREEVAGPLGGSSQSGGFRTTDLDNSGAFIAERDISGTVSSKWSKGAGGPAGDEVQNLVAHTLSAEGFDASEDGTGRGTPLVPTHPPLAVHGTQDPDVLLGTAHALGRNHGQENAVAIQERAISENPEAGPDGVGVRDDGAAYTLEARQVPQAVAFAENSRGELRLEGGAGDVSGALGTGGGKPGQGHPSIAFDMRGWDGGAMPEGPHDTASIRAASGGSSRSYIAQEWAVRRLMPLECERLQGFPDGHTAIPWRCKPASACPDGPRYKALGNSMAVNVMRWLGERIELVNSL